MSLQFKPDGTLIDSAVSQQNIAVIADALRRTTHLMQVHYWLHGTARKPEDISLPPENTLEAARQVLGWAAALIAGDTAVEMPTLPDEEALSSMCRSLEKARWSGRR